MIPAPTGVRVWLATRRGKNATAISPIALEAVKRIDALFDIERGINGHSAEERLRVRREQSAPLLAALEAWLREQRPRLSRSSSVTEPITHRLLLHSTKKPSLPKVRKIRHVIRSIICCRAGIGLPASSTMAGSA
jgi:hypothetical protein